MIAFGLCEKNRVENRRHQPFECGSRTAALSRITVTRRNWAADCLEPGADAENVLSWPENTAANGRCNGKSERISRGSKPNGYLQGQFDQPNFMTDGTMRSDSGFQLKQGGPEVYEQCWVRAQMGRAAEELVTAAVVRSGHRVLDVACGTGVVARTAARVSGAAANVTGTDVSAGMLEAAERFAIEAGLTEIEWVECDAAHIPLPDTEFDVVLCQQGLQFMPDKAGAMSEMARLLKPGGRLAISVWKTRSALGSAFATVLDREFGEGTTAPWEMVYSLGNREKLHELSEAAGLRDAHVVLDVKFARYPDTKAFITGALAGSPLAGTMAELSEAEHRRLVGEIVAQLSEFHDDDGLAVPSQCLTLTARK